MNSKRMRFHIFGFSMAGTSAHFRRNNRIFPIFGLCTWYELAPGMQSTLSADRPRVPKPLDVKRCFTIFYASRLLRPTGPHGERGRAPGGFHCGEFESSRVKQRKLDSEIDLVGKSSIFENM